MILRGDFHPAGFDQIGAAAAHFAFLEDDPPMCTVSHLPTEADAATRRGMARLMQNLSDDAQPFRQSFANALKKSTIRRTSQEREGRGLAETFASQAKHMLETFKHKRKGESEVAAMVGTAGQIDALVYNLHLNP